MKYFSISIRQDSQRNSWKNIRKSITVIEIVESHVRAIPLLVFYVSKRTIVGEFKKRKKCQKIYLQSKQRNQHGTHESMGDNKEREILGHFGSDVNGYFVATATVDRQKTANRCGPDGTVHRFPAAGG